jgi:mannonate dehydratase
MSVAIRDVCAVAVQPDRQPLLVVKVATTEPELFGLGCATFTQRFRAVQSAVEDYLKPLLVGRDPFAIEEIWQLTMVNGYWRSGPVLNNAVSGVDMALWDIKGKAAGVPCYQLWGGASRTGAAVYVHANGSTREELADRAARYLREGFRHVRCQLGGYQGTGRGMPPGPDGSPAGAYFDGREKMRLVPGAFAYLRERLGEEVELLYDIHERMQPVDSIWLARALEPYRLFFLEDLFAPEDISWFEVLRQQTATPIAMGELFANPVEWRHLISRHLIDFIRVHVSTIGGITPAIKLAHLCDAFGVRTAWHGPGDVSPVGMAANVHMDVHLPNFGIQEWAFRSKAEGELFDGIPEVRSGYAYPNGRPGLGITMDEGIAARMPATNPVIEWTQSRRADGSIGRP